MQYEFFQWFKTIVSHLRIDEKISGAAVRFIAKWKFLKIFLGG